MYNIDHNYFYLSPRCSCIFKQETKMFWETEFFYLRQNFFFCKFKNLDHLDNKYNDARYPKTFYYFFILFSKQASISGNSMQTNSHIMESYHRNWELKNASCGRSPDWNISKYFLPHEELPNWCLWYAKICSI